VWTGALILPLLLARSSRHSFMESLLGAVKSSAYGSFLLAPTCSNRLQWGLLAFLKLWLCGLRAMSLSPMNDFISDGFICGYGCSWWISRICFTVAVYCLMVQRPRTSICRFVIFIVLCKCRNNPALGFNYCDSEGLQETSLYVQKPLAVLRSLRSHSFDQYFSEIDLFTGPHVAKLTRPHY